MSPPAARKPSVRPSTRVPVTGSVEASKAAAAAAVATTAQRLGKSSHAVLDPRKTSILQPTPRDAAGRYRSPLDALRRPAETIVAVTTAIRRTVRSSRPVHEQDRVERSLAQKLEWFRHFVRNDVANLSTALQPLGHARAEDHAHSVMQAAAMHPMIVPEVAHIVAQNYLPLMQGTIGARLLALTDLLVSVQRSAGRSKAIAVADALKVAGPADQRLARLLKLGIPQEVVPSDLKTMWKRRLYRQDAEEILGLYSPAIEGVTRFPREGPNRFEGTSAEVMERMRGFIEQDIVAIRSYASEYRDPHIDTHSADSADSASQRSIQTEKLAHWLRDGQRRQVQLAEAALNDSTDVRSLIDKLYGAAQADDGLLNGHSR